MDHSPRRTRPHFKRWRWVARIAVGAGFLALGLVALQGLHLAFPGFAELSNLELALLALLVLASQGTRGLIDRVAHRAFGVPPPSDREGAFDLYREAASQALREGRRPAEDPNLALLAAELGIASRSAEVLVRMAEADLGHPLAEGGLVAGRYRLRRVLGRGGAGRAFLARDELLDRDVVVKEVVHRVGSGFEAALREARLAGSCQHPNVVAVHDVLPGQGRSLLVTEYLPGGTLEDQIARDGPLGLAEGLRILDAVLAGLAAVHRRGVVHGDLKPGNILVADDGSPKLADFGVATSAGSRGEGAGFRGTPGFMAPEQQRGEPATARSDVYAVGLLARKCMAQPLPPALEAVVARALAGNPGDRWASADAMRSALPSAGLR